MANIYYDAQVDNAQNTIPDTQTTNNNTDNWQDKAKDNGITLLYNADGEVIGKRYTNTSNQIDSNGYVEIPEDSDVIMTKDETSTTGNIIINYQVPPQTTTENGTVIKQGSTSIYADYDEFVKAVLSTTGLDVEMGELSAETYNRIFESAQNYVTDIDGQTAYSRQKIMMNMRVDDDGNARYFMKDDVALAIIKVANDAGLYGVDAILEDDPVFKAQMRTAEVGSFIGFNGVDFGFDYDDSNLLSLLFAKLMTYAFTYSTYHGGAFQPTASFQNYKFGNDIGTNFINSQMQTQYNKNCNAWLCNCWNTGVDGTEYQLSGIHVGDGNQVEIVQNYPQYGFAYVNYNNMTGNIICGTNYSGRYDTYVVRYLKNGDFTQQVGSNYINRTFMIVYDSEAFVNFLATEDAGTRDYPLYSIVVANCVVRQTQEPGVHKRDDVAQLSPLLTKEQIESAINIQYPDWYGDTYEVTEYDVAGDTYVTNRYYPVSITGEDSRSGETTKEVERIIERIPNPFNVVVDPWDYTTNSNTLYTIYRPQNNDVVTLGRILWNSSIMQSIRNIFQNPMDGVISFHDLYLNPNIDEGSKQVYMGSVAMVDGTTPFKLQTISNRFIDVDFGEVAIPNYYSDARDIESTNVTIYIPFCGWHQLKSEDVMGKSVSLKIRCDVCTGDFLATISAKSVTTNGSSQYNPLYTFDGNCSVQTPLTSADRTRMITGAFSTGLSAMTGNYIGVASNAMGMIHNSVSINRGNGFKMSSGALTNYRTPFIMVHRPIPADADNFNELYGYQSMKRVTLSRCSGYTKVAHCHVDTVTCTDSERTLIESILKEGIIV